MRQLEENLASAQAAGTALHNRIVLLEHEKTALIEELTLTEGSAYVEFILQEVSAKLPS